MIDLMKFWLYTIAALFVACYLILFHAHFHRKWLPLATADIQPYHRHLENVTSFDSKHCNQLSNLKKVLLAINYNHPHYLSITILKKLYAPIFGKVVFCGSTDFADVIKINEQHGYLGYECIGTTIRTFPQFEGYLYMNDDVVVNWWNLLKLDMSQIWTGTEIYYNNRRGHVFGETRLPAWHWWKTARAAYFCEKAFDKVIKLSRTREGRRLNLPSYVKRFYRNTNNRKVCVHSWSDIFYIPKQYSKLYAKLSQIYSRTNVFLEVAVPGILAFLMNRTNHYNLNGLYLNQRYGYSPKYLSGDAFFETYTFDLTFSHPLKLEGEKQAANWNFLKNVVLAYGKNVKRYCT